MGGFIFFIIVIVVIVNISKKAQEQNKSINEYLNNVLNSKIESRPTYTQHKPNSVNNEASYQINKQPNSYYNKEKIDKYKKQDMDHAEHLVENETIDTKKIGYNKCPNCGTMNSKKLDRCFMCDARIIHVIHEFLY